MSSLRSKLERTAEETSPPVPIPQDRRRSGSHAGEAASVRFTRDRDLPQAMRQPPKTQAELDVDRRVAAQHRQWEDQEREDRENKRKWDEGVRQERIAAENKRQRENAKAVEELIDAQILTVLDNATNKEAVAVGVLIRTKYFASREPSIWELALSEVRQQARARDQFGFILLKDIEAMSDEDLAKHLGCDMKFAATLRREM